MCGPEPATGQDDEVHFAAVAIAPDQQALAARSGSCGAIEIEFASRARLRVTGAVDVTMLQATIEALTKGSRRR